MKPASSLVSNDTHLRSEDKAVNMLLAKLDEGTQTVINLRSLLTLKTAELNELIAQLELTNQAIMTVESTTTQIENMLKDLGLSADSNDHTRESLLMNAEASLDSAIKSASSIYPQQFKPPAIRRPSSASTNSGGDEKRLSNTRMFASKIKYKPDTKHILRKLNNLLRELELDSGKFFENLGTTDNYEVLQKAYVDLDIAKTVSLSAKSNMKRRTILLKSARRGAKMDEIKMLGDKIREGVNLWMTYTKNAPLLINGVDITTILKREDELLTKNVRIGVYTITYGPTRNRNSMTPSNSNYTRASMQSSSSVQSNSTVESVPRSHTRTHSVQPSTVESLQRSVYTRTSSIPTIDSIYSPQNSLPSSPVIKPINSNAAPIMTSKKLYRQSAGARLTQVKASVGLPRVRTTSLTQKTATAVSYPSSKVTTKDNPVNTKSNTPANTKSNNPTNYRTHESTAIPSPVSATNSSVTSNSSTSSNNTTTTTTPAAPLDKKSLLKQPAQRGPGSTLRLRSMLARRNQPNKPSE
ncbi:hypothetical protein BDB01DRAFT_715838 [Pilobolus umbonatus]|nr:hypothetical protein BDB01DRAFT_715838 [Pilobolus umbonatus]